MLNFSCLFFLFLNPPLLFDNHPLIQNIYSPRYCLLWEYIAALDQKVCSCATEVGLWLLLAFCLPYLGFVSEGALCHCHDTPVVLQTRPDHLSPHPSSVPGLPLWMSLLQPYSGVRIAGDQGNPTGCSLHHGGQLANWLKLETLAMRRGGFQVPSYCIPSYHPEVIVINQFIVTLFDASLREGLHRRLRNYSSFLRKWLSHTHWSSVKKMFNITLSFPTGFRPSNITAAHEYWWKASLA